MTVMEKQQLAELIAARLSAGLMHPGNPKNRQSPTPIILPIFRTAGMPPQMAELAQQTSKLLGEAIVHLITNEAHCEIVDREWLDNLRNSTEDSRIVSVHCHCDRSRNDPLFYLTVDIGPRVVVDGPKFISGLISRSSQCPHNSGGSA